VIEELKQRVSAKTQRLSGQGKSKKQYYQNKTFRTKNKKFCSFLRQKNINKKNAPTKEEIQDFWKEIIGKKKSKTLKKLSGSKTSAGKTAVWNGAQYMKRRSQRY